MAHRKRKNKRVILIFGITGMLGHVLYQNLKEDFEVYGTTRDGEDNFTKEYSIFKNNNKNVIYKIDVLSKEAINTAVEKANPNVVINCVGIVKQLREAEDPVLSICVNSLFPHLLAARCLAANIKLIHISTDCVFSGKKGLYRETDPADADDIYGRTKYLGEVSGPDCLTIRTSLIGRELREKKSLLEWFLAQNGQVKGYKKAIFSGLTTYTFAEILKEIIVKYPQLNGIYHVASDPINKYALLMRLRGIYKKDIEIIPDETVKVDRSLDAGKFKNDTSIKIPKWDEMLEDSRMRIKA
jgi:dTDP-4-dehydrorhamnose reductase